MTYPKIINGKVKNTGYPIDGHTLYFSQWDYDPESWHLYSWDDADDEAVMLTMYQSEIEAGICLHDSLESFKAAWRAKEWQPQGVFCLDLDKVDVMEVIRNIPDDDM